MKFENNGQKVLNIEKDGKQNLKNLYCKITPITVKALQINKTIIYNTITEYNVEDHPFLTLTPVNSSKTNMMICGFIFQTQCKRQ